MQISEITSPGKYVVVAAGGVQMVLEVTHGIDDTLWGELVPFTMRVTKRDWPEKDIRELKIMQPDDRYTYQPVRSYVGEAIYTLKEFGHNTLGVEHDD